MDELEQRVDKFLRARFNYGESLLSARLSSLENCHPSDGLGVQLPNSPPIKIMDEITYLKLTKTSRQAHMNLEISCKERGGNSTNHRGVLAQFLDTAIFSRPILLCHGCNNAKCSNPVHLYWGTAKENHEDAVLAGAIVSPWQACVSKFGYEEACRRNRRVAQLAEATDLNPVK